MKYRNIVDQRKSSLKMLTDRQQMFAYTFKLTYWPFPQVNYNVDIFKKVLDSVKTLSIHSNSYLNVHSSIPHDIHHKLAEKCLSHTL